MPFGLCNAGATFQRLMESVLRNLQWRTCLVYIDDIIVYVPTFPLKLTPQKCRFLHPEITFLGCVISAEGIRPSKGKTAVIESFEAPKNQKQVRAWLGLTGFFRRFIDKYANIAAPLNTLLQKDKPFQWTNECQQAFETLRTKLLTAPILAFPDFTRPFELHTDASGTAIGSVLMQIQQDDSERVIAYGGRTLLKAERNYNVTELECLAVIDAIKHFSPYLHGYKFTIHTDHSSLKYLLTAKDLKGRAARWALTLQGFDFTILHRAGKDNAAPDAISRLQSSEVTPPESHPIQIPTSEEMDKALPDAIRRSEEPNLCRISVPQPRNNVQTSQIYLEYTNRQ